MKKYLFLFLILIPSIVNAQQSVLNDVTSKQQDIATRTQQIAVDTQWASNANADIVTQQNAITADNAIIAYDESANAQYQANTAQTVMGVNWNYFVSLEPADPFSSWSKIQNGINWTTIVPLLGINCGGITEANVNWSNWGNCESKGMTPGTPFGGKNTGIAAFWCGNGSIAGTC